MNNDTFKRTIKLRLADGTLVSLRDFETTQSPELSALKARIPVIGGPDIEIRPSNIANAGNGLFVKRDFVKNEIVTFFDGALIKYQHPDTLDPSIFSHARGLFPMSYTILGNVSRDGRRFLSDPSDYIGYGGGAIANDGRSKSKNNAYFEHINNEANEQDPLLRDPNGRLIVVVANKAISKGSEVLVDYGVNYWKPRNSGASGKPRVGINDVPSLLVRGTLPLDLHCANDGCREMATGFCTACFDTPFCSATCFQQTNATHAAECTGQLRGVYLY